MKKLTPVIIQQIVRDYKVGISVAELAQKYQVVKPSIYYHLKHKCIYKFVAHPKCYNDYLANSIVKIEDRIDNGFYTEEQLKYAISELNRLKTWLKKDKTIMTDDAYIQQ